MEAKIRKKYCRKNYKRNKIKFRMSLSKKKIPSTIVQEMILLNMNVIETTYPELATEEIILLNTATTPSQSYVQNKNFGGVSHDHNYSIDKVRVEELKKTVVKMGTLIEDLQNEIEHCAAHIASQDEQISKLSRENLALKRKHNKVRMHSFRYDGISHNAHALYFYTGFGSVSKVNMLINFLRDSYYHTLSKIYLSSSLGMEDQLFMILCQLKLGLQQTNLASRFVVPLKGVNALSKFWIDFLHTTLTNHRVPEQIIILDCAHLTTHSRPNKKLKSLIGISSDGFVRFVSDLYSEEFSDTAITQLSGVLNTLRNHTCVITDHGFHIKHLCEARKLNLLQDKSNIIIKNEICDTATIRIQFEKVVRKIKSFRILSTYFLRQEDLNKVWIICCYLINFMSDH